MKLFLAVLMLCAGTMPAAAQWLDRPWSGIPRTADGKPDLTAPAPRKRVLQTPTALAILNADLTYRVIHMDGRELESRAP